VGIVPPDIQGVTDWEPLARGGFATVWRARQPSLNRPVAVKVDDRTLEQESERRRFLGEAGAAGNLSGHPSIVTVYDTGILTNGRPYLVMKYCSGGSLTSWLKPENRQSTERICFVGVRIAEALVVAHEQGMLHRDVKPANILIDSYGNPGLADFGLTALEPGSTIGLTVAYAPPEVILGGKPSELGDVYQLAATLYALLSGNPPSNSSGGNMSLEDRIARVREPVKALPGVDKDLMELLLDGLAFEPTDRPTAAQFRDRLAALGVSTATKKRPGARQIVLGLLAATVVALVFALLGSSVVYLYEIDRSVTANINRGLDLPPEQTDGQPRPVKNPQADQTLDYLLIGTDNDPGHNDGGRSDSLMLLHVNQARDQAYVISIPRTTLVTIPGHGRQTINNAYELGGPPLVVRTVEKLTQTRIDHVVTADFPGFVKLTDDLGGVTVKNRVAFTTFPVGTVNLSGDAALRYVRDRPPPPTEKQRAENQRNVLKAILAKGLSAEVIADPARFTTFLGNAAKRIQVDKTLTDTEVRATALSIRMKASDITVLPAPVGGERNNVYPIDSAQLDALSQALRDDTMADYVKQYPN